MNLGGVIHLNKTGFCLICAVVLILFLYASSNRNVEDPEISANNDDASSYGKIGLKSLLKLAIRAAENGGIQVVQTKDSFKVNSKGLTKEGLQDSVTTADYYSHCAMTATLKSIYPKLNIISEEAKLNCDNIKDQKSLIRDQKNIFTDSNTEKWVNYKDVTVWIDPLDATHEYIEGLFEYVTTMVCVAVKGRPIIGVIHKPFLKEEKQRTAWAYDGILNNLEHNKNTSNHNKYKLIISRSHRGDIQSVLDKNLKDYELIIAAGAGYKGLEVARGNVDAYLHITAIKKWDICAVDAIINAVGGKMTTKLGEVIDYTDLSNVKNENGLVASLKNHQRFIDALK